MYLWCIKGESPSNKFRVQADDYEAWVSSNACLVFSRFFYLIAYGSIHQGHEQFSDNKRQEIFMCLDAFLCQQFLQIREWRSKDIDRWITSIIHIDET